MYAIAITPLINHLESEQIKHVWFTDDATAGGELSSLRSWWDHIVRLGPDYGYHVNATKTWLIVNESILEEVTTLFEGTGVAMTVEGRQHLGAAIGTPAFIQNYAQKKMAGWVKEVEHLSSIAISQPHAAYAAFTHGLIHKWTYLSRIIPNLEELFKPLEDTIRQQFLPSLTGQNAFNDSERDLMALPSHHGGLGIINPVTGICSL